MTDTRDGLPVDHLVLATPDVAATVDALAERSGVRAVAGGRHVGLGTWNHLVSLGGGAYLEIIGPDPTQPPPPRPRAFGIDEMTAERLVGFAVRSDDLAAAVAGSRAAGYDPGEPGAMARRTPEGELLEWELTPGPGLEGLVPFLIDWKRTRHPSASSPAGLRLVELRGEHPEPDRVRSALRALGVVLEVDAGPHPALTATVDSPQGRLELH